MVAQTAPLMAAGREVIGTSNRGGFRWHPAHFRALSRSRNHCGMAGWHGEKECDLLKSTDEALDGHDPTSDRDCNAGDTGRSWPGACGQAVRSAGSWRQRTAATLDAPDHRSTSSTISPTAARARPVASTNRLARREHPLARAAASSWLDCQQRLSGAHPAAAQDGGEVFSSSAWNQQTGVDFPHSPRRRPCGNPVAAGSLWTRLANTSPPSIAPPCQLFLAPPVRTPGCGWDAGGPGIKKKKKLPSGVLDHSPILRLL